MGVIPDTWLKSHEKCTWPDYKTMHRNVKAVVNRVVSEPDWPTYDIKVLSSTGKLISYLDIGIYCFMEKHIRCYLLKL